LRLWVQLRDDSSTLGASRKLLPVTMACIMVVLTDDFSSADVFRRRRSRHNTIGSSRRHRSSSDLPIPRRSLLCISVDSSVHLRVWLDWKVNDCQSRLYSSLVRSRPIQSDIEYRCVDICQYPSIKPILVRVNQTRYSYCWVVCSPFIRPSTATIIRNQAYVICTND
jgi:hypothetical protein